MNRPAYSGAYSQRRFSNYAASSGSKASTNASGDSGGSGSYSLSVTSANPEMGEAGFVQITTASPLSTNSAMQYPQANVRGGYAAGNTFKAIARANEGFRFVQWQTNIDGVGNTSQNPIEFKLTKNTWLTAHFEKIKGSDPQLRTANVSWNGAMGRVSGNGLVYGSGTPANSGTITATQGATVTLNAEPKDGYHFVKWTGGPSNGKETSKAYTFQMNNNYNITAEFAADDPGTGGGGGGTGGGGDGEVPAPTPGNPTVKTKESGVMAFVKKWWWAILIVAYIVYKEGKGGSK